MSNTNSGASNDLPKGWTCDCGLEHRFHPWVYAHWDIFITGQCHDEGNNKGCGKKFTFRRGLKLKFMEEEDNE